MYILVRWRQLFILGINFDFKCQNSAIGKFYILFYALYMSQKKFFTGKILCTKNGQKNLVFILAKDHYSLTDNYFLFSYTTFFFEVYHARYKLCISIAKAFSLLKLVMTNTDWEVASIFFFIGMTLTEPKSSWSKPWSTTTKSNLLGYWFIN